MNPTNYEVAESVTDYRVRFVGRRLRRKIAETTVLLYGHYEYDELLRRVEKKVRREESLGWVTSMILSIVVKLIVDAILERWIENREGVGHA